jgi:hypothetical protein
MARLAALACPVHGERAHWHVLDVQGRARFGQYRARFDPGRVQACSGRFGDAPGQGGCGQR